MKNFLITLTLVAFLVASCKKEKPNVVPPQPAPALTWKLNKTWIMSGYYSSNWYPEQGQPTTTVVQINHTSKIITVLNDTTILFAKDTLVQYQDNTTGGYIEYIPPIFKSIGQRYEPTNLKYYYNKDSVTYLYRMSGHAFVDSTVLYTQ